MILAIGVGVAAYVLVPFFDAIGVYTAPGLMFLSLIPSKLVYWLDPAGGPAIGVFLLVLCAAFFWTVLFGAAHFGWASLRRRA
jgi:hypothetical protein